MFSCNSLRRSLVLSWTTSFVLHAAFVALVLADALTLISVSFQPAATTAPSKVVTVAGGWSKLEPAKESIPLRLKLEPPPIASPDDVAATTEDKPEVKPVDAGAVESPRLDSMVQQSIEQAQGKSNRENADKLRELTGTLNSVSDADSIAGLTNSLNRVFQTAPRATEPAKEPVAGEFDFNTAQIHDVRREESQTGGFTYTAILLDSAGRTLDSELDAETGAQIYEVMSLIKNNPLLATLYRKTLMGLFDKMMQPGSSNSAPQSSPSSTSTAAPPAEVKPNSPQPGVPFDPFAE